MATLSLCPCNDTLACRRPTTRPTRPPARPADCAAKLVLQQGFCAVCRQKVTAKQVVRVAAGGSTSGGAACDPEFEALGGVSGILSLLNIARGCGNTLG